MHYSKNILLNLALCGILSGICITNIIEDFLLVFILIVILFLLGVILWLYYRQFVIPALCFMACFILGTFYSVYSLNNIKEKSVIVDSYNWLYLSYSWEVWKLYRRSDFYDEYVMNLRQVWESNVDVNISHLLRVPKNFSLVPGQLVSYNGKMYPLEDFDGFSYKKYMIASGIYFSTSTQVVDKIGEIPKGLRYYFYVSREKLLAQITRIFPEEEAIFLWGILFWARENIPQDLKEDFNNSGLTHFIAVSGFNITLCVIFITFLFWFLPPLARIITVSVTIVAFSLFVGLGAPVVRAAIMGILWYIFLQSGNNAKNITILLFAAVCMTLYSPLALNYDVSLHLSFLAVIWIIYTQEFFGKVFRFIPSIFAIREAFVLTLAALSFSLPIMIFQFGQVSLLAPFANIAVTWTIPLAMIAWALTLIVDNISSTLWVGFWFVTWILLHYDIFMVRFFGNIDWALLKLDFWPYSIYLEILYFIVLSYIICIFWIKDKA